jgi:CBS domain-containing protein
VKEEFSVSADNLVSKVKELIREGNITRIIVKDEEGKTLLEIPATVGVVGVILAPWLAALGAIAALATRCTISVEKRE